MRDDLLPLNATPQERAVAATASRVSDVPMLARESWDPDTCPAQLLPWLAWARSVDKWDTNWTEQQKRDAIKASVYVHRHKGTPSAMQSALDALGYDLDLVEWHQLTPKGDPYTFGMVIDVMETGVPSEAVFDQLTDVANAAKNVRSHLKFINMKGTVAGDFYVGGVVFCGEIVSIGSGEQGDIDQIVMGRGAHTFTRDTGGRLLTDTCVINGSNYVQTYTRDSYGNLVSVSDWIKQ